MRNIKCIANLICSICIIYQYRIDIVLACPLIINNFFIFDEQILEALIFFE